MTPNFAEFKEAIQFALWEGFNYTVTDTDAYGTQECKFTKSLGIDGIYAYNGPETIKSYVGRELDLVLENGLNSTVTTTTIQAIDFEYDEYITVTLKDTLEVA